MHFSNQVHHRPRQEGSRHPASLSNLARPCLTVEGGQGLTLVEPRRARGILGSPHLVPGRQPWQDGPSLGPEWPVAALSGGTNVQGPLEMGREGKEGSSLLFPQIRRLTLGPGSECQVTHVRRELS